VELSAAMEPSGLYDAWFERHGCVAALVRPDFYVFGTAVTAEDISGLVERLGTALAGEHPTPEERHAP